MTAWLQLALATVVLVVTATVAVSEIKVLGIQIENLTTAVAGLDCHMDEADERHYKLRKRVTRLED